MKKKILLLISIVVIIAIIIFGAMLLLGNNATEDEELSEEFVEENENNEPHQEEPIEETTPNKIDLGELVEPYLASTNAQELCESMIFATWYQESDIVGCIGIGLPNCADPSILELKDYCVSAGAEWHCSLTEIYCAYRDWS